MTAPVHRGLLTCLLLTMLPACPGSHDTTSRPQVVAPQPAAQDLVAVPRRMAGVHGSGGSSIGYLNHADSAANVLFGVVDHRYLDRKPMIFTTNKRLRDWGLVLHDRDLAQVILDRVLGRGQHIQLRGLSWRTKHLDPDLFADEDPDPECLRIPGSLREPPAGP